MKLFLLFLILGTLFSVSESSYFGGCGNRPLVDDIRVYRVVEGTDTAPGRWPWIISIQEYRGNAYFHVCGGVIINTLWVLTAAHCFKNRSNEIYSWRLVFGASELSDMETKTQIRTIQELIQHKEYDPETESNDIALLRINEKILYNEFTQPACLPAKQAVLMKMTDCYIAGWGILKRPSSGTSNTLQEAPGNLIPVERCNSSNWYNGAVCDYNLCAGYEKDSVDSCQGDSGGPLMCKRSKARFYYVVGITSWGSACALKHGPRVYTSTQYYLDWISEHLSNKEEDNSGIRKKRAVNKTIWQTIAELVFPRMFQK